ncbi:cyclophilin-like fold protein [Rhodovulum sp. DZ06]|uniref:cyclophilin-like fold protein n=1 Tax=Rhodovulum sp. DZ06 TaxID=3425126 RepID=UPI003D356D06
MTAIRILIGDAVLPATLDDTPAGRDFAALLPLDLDLADYHGIERVADLPRKLDRTGAPARAAAHAGDIMLYAPWGNLAIFLEPFGSTPGLVKLGAVAGDLGALHKTGPARFEIAG